MTTIDHGTRAFRLTPSCLLSTATVDFERRIENKRRAADGNDDSFLRYAFLAMHVKPAKQPIDILVRALKDVQKKHEKILAKLETRSTQVRQLYADIDILQAAIDLAKKRDAENVSPLE